jgi:putative peptide zinc metalloprotease protein
MEAILVVAQTHIQDVRPGQAVRLKLDQFPGQVIPGRIDEVSRTPLDQAPPELALSGRLAVHFDQDDVPRPTDRCYEVRATLTEVPRGLLTGTSGHAKILAPPRTIAGRLAKFVKRTFHFDL